MGVVKRGEVSWVNLDSTIGTEIKKTRPALPRVIIAPLTSKGQPLGCRSEVKFAGKPARILLDQLRTVNKQRLAGKMGKIELAKWHPLLLEMLA